MREFNIDITLAAEVSHFLKELIEAAYTGELDPDAPVTDTYLDQFFNGFKPNAEVAAALKEIGRAHV